MSELPLDYSGNATDLKVGVQRHTVPHFKALIKLDWNQKRPRA